MSWQKGRAEKRRIAEALEALNKLTDEQRREVFGHFCRECGADDPRCQCWNDE